MNQYLLKVMSLVGLVLATIACSSGGGSTNTGDLPEPQVVLSNTHACTLDNYEGHGALVQCCTGEFCMVPELNNPKKIGVGDGFSCALDDDDVHCWGAEEHINGTWDDTYAIGAPQGLQNPRDLFVGETYVCALDDHGVFCWGQGDNFETVVPFLSNPTMLSYGDIPCALDDTGVVCWGQLGTTLTSGYSVPEVTSAVSAIYAFGWVGFRVGVKVAACVIGSGDLQCWGNYWDWVNDLSNFYSFLSPPPGGVKAVELAGTDDSCAIVDDILRCWRWGTDSTYIERNLPVFNQPKSIAISAQTIIVRECSFGSGGQISCSDVSRDVPIYCALANSNFAHCWRYEYLDHEVLLPRFPSRGALSTLLQ